MRGNRHIPRFRRRGYLMTGIMCAFMGSGSTTTPATDTQTVNVGVYSNLSKYFSEYVFGFSTNVSTGSISDGTFNLISNAPITELNYHDFNGTLTIQFQITGIYPNSGWTTMDIGVTPYTRASASFSAGSGVTIWSWTTATNPFGSTAGVNKIVNFT